MREAWTDARLDDLNERVADMGRRMDEGFNRVHEDLNRVHEDLNGVHEDLRSSRAEFGSLRGEVDSKINALRAETRTEFASLHRLILQVGGGMVATFGVGFLSLVGALS